MTHTHTLTETYTLQQWPLCHWHTLVIVTSPVTCTLTWPHDIPWPLINTRSLSIVIDSQSHVSDFVSFCLSVWSVSVRSLSLQNCRYYATFQNLLRLFRSVQTTMTRVVRLRWLMWFTYCRFLRKHLKCHFFLHIELNTWLWHMLQQSIKVSLIASSVEKLIYLFLIRTILTKTDTVQGLG
jgi:hypothetical protein